MKKLLKLAKGYPLTIVCIVLIIYLSIFFKPFKSPLDGVAFIDKWTHLVMYGGSSTVFWWEYLRNHAYHTMLSTFFWGWLTFVSISGIMELVQEYCTSNRSGEWLDLAANATGATIGTLIGLGIRNWKSES